MSKNQIMKLSPSDGFLKKSCPHCYRAKLVSGWKRPYSPLPGVLNRVDRAMKDYFQALGYAMGGTVNTKPGQVKSQVFQVDGVSFQIKGRPDAFIEMPDGSVKIVDFKCSGQQKKESLEDFRNRMVSSYFTQMNDYAYCMVHPEKNKHKPVIGLYLVCLSPSQILGESPEGDLFLTICDRVVVEIPLDWGKLLEERRQLAKLIKSEQQNDPDCVFCVGRVNGWGVVRDV